jgi:hypothetical protein
MRNWICPSPNSACTLLPSGHSPVTIRMASRFSSWRNPKVMEGGIMVWPYPREK